MATCPLAFIKTKCSNIVSVKAFVFELLFINLENEKTCSTGAEDTIHYLLYIPEETFFTRGYFWKVCIVASCSSKYCSNSTAILFFNIGILWSLLRLNLWRGGQLCTSTVGLIKKNLSWFYEESWVSSWMSWLSSFCQQLQQCCSKHLSTLA